VVRQYGCGPDPALALPRLSCRAILSSWLGADQASDLLAGLTGPGTIAALIRPTTVEGLDVLPASPSLVGAERVLAGEVGAETLLRRALAPFEARWRFVLVDTPPTLGILTINALVAAREVLVPVDCHALALAGLVQLLDMIEGKAPSRNG